MSVELLHEGTYRGFVEDVQIPGREPIHIARVQFGDGMIRRAYVKIYPPPDRNRGLFNEIAGYLLARALGMKVPERVAVLLVPRDAIPCPLSWTGSEEESFPAWCSMDMVAPSIKFFFSIGDRSSKEDYGPVQKEMEKSKRIPAIFAFDDWVANVDRNVGNLLRLAQGEYVLIDHGQILGGDCWNPAILKDTNKKFPNKLRKLFELKSKTLPFQSQVVSCCQQHAQALENAWVEIEQWWSDMELSNDDLQAAQVFLHARAHFENLPQRYGLLL